MNIIVPSRFESSIRRSRSTEGPLCVKRSLYSSGLLGGMNRSRSAMSTLAGGTAREGENDIVASEAL